MSQSSERLEQINRQQADDYWVLVRHEVCASYLGVHVVPVPYLEDAERYDLLNVLLKKSEDVHSRLLQRKSFFPLGPLKEIVATIDSRNFEMMEQRVKHKTKYTDDFDHEEVVIDEGVLKSIKLIVKNVNKEVSLFFLKPEVLRVSDSLPRVYSVRSLYIVYEVFYTTNIQLLVTDSKLTQQFKSQSRIPIGFLCRKFRLEASGLIGEELTMRKSPRRANFVNSSSTVHHAVVGRHNQGTGEAPGAPARSTGVPRLFRSILTDCCLSRSRGDVKPSGAAPGALGPPARNERGSEQPAAPSAPGEDHEAVFRDPSKAGASVNALNSKGRGSAGVPSHLPLKAKSLITLMSPPDPSDLTPGGRHGAPGSDAPAGTWPSLFPDRFSNRPRSDSGSPSALRPLEDTIVVSQKAAVSSASPQSVADSLDVPQKIAEYSASPQSVADSLDVPQKVAEYSPSPQSVAVSLDVPQKIAEYSASPQSVADSLDVPQKVAEYSPSPQSVAVSLDVPQKIAEYSASPQSVADSLDVPQKVAEYSPSPQSVADSLDVPQKVAEYSASPQSVADSLDVPQKVAEYSPSPQSVAVSLDVPQKIAEYSASPQSVADSLDVPQKVAEYSPSPQSVAVSLDVPQKIAEYSASPQSVADSLDVPQKVAEYSPSPQSVADSLDVPQKVAEYSASPQSVADSLDVPQKVAESAVSPQSVAENLLVPHTAAKCINLPQSIAESLLVQQTIAGAAASPQSIAASPLARRAPAGSAAPQRSVAALRWCADTGAGGSLPPPCAERLSAGGQPAARATTSSASSSSSSSPGGAARPPAPRYQDSEPGETPPRRTDCSALIPTIQDLIGLLQAIVLSQHPPPCSCPTPPATRRPRLSPGLGRPWGTPLAQDRRGSSPRTSPQPTHAAPGTRRRSPARRRPLPPWTPGSSSSTETEPRRPQLQIHPLTALLREAARPIHCLPDPSPATLREAAWPVDCLPVSSPAPLREAARPVDCLPATSPAVPQPRCRLLAPSEGEESPAGPSPRDRGLGIPSVAIAQPQLVHSPPRWPPGPSPSCPPASAPGRCQFCSPALGAESRGVRAAQVPGRLPDGCRCEQEWERRLAAASPEPGAEPVLRSLRHMMPTSSDSEGEERAAGAGR